MSEQNLASAVQSGRKAPLKKETEESQKEQAVSQQICEDGATPTGSQARRRSGPASMAASYLNIADFLAKQGVRPSGGGELRLLSQKPVCNSKEIPLALFQQTVRIQ